MGPLVFIDQHRGQVLTPFSSSVEDFSSLPLLSHHLCLTNLPNQWRSRKFHYFHSVFPRVGVPFGRVLLQGAVLVLPPDGVQPLLAPVVPRPARLSRVDHLLTLGLAGEAGDLVDHPLPHALAHLGPAGEAVLASTVCRGRVLLA